MKDAGREEGGNAGQMGNLWPTPFQVHWDRSELHAPINLLSHILG